jgi:hypothetical protein
MADSITIIALQPLQTLTPSGVIQWVRGAATLGTQTTWARPSIQNPPKGAEAPSLPDLFIVRVSDLGGSYCPRYDFSHFNRPWTRIFQGAPAIVILLPIAKITSQVGKSRSARTATDTAPSIWKVLDRVLCLSSSRCTLKRVLQGMRAQWTLADSNGRAVIMRCCLDMKIFDERGAQNEQGLSERELHWCGLT